MSEKRMLNPTNNTNLSSSPRDGDQGNPFKQSKVTRMSTIAGLSF